MFSAETTLLQDKSELPLVETPSEQNLTSEQPAEMQLRSPNDENEELSKYNIGAPRLLKFKFILIRRRRHCELSAQIIKRRASRHENKPIHVAF